MDLDDRKKKILRAIIDNYVKTAEPVSSKSIVTASMLGLSSATIRNEMSELESMGYLEKPHTSAGRIPSPLGYRIYVDELMQRHCVTGNEAELIEENLAIKMSGSDKLIADAGRLTSKITHYPSYTFHTAGTKTTILRFDLIQIDGFNFIIVLLLSNKSVKNKLIALPFFVEHQMLIKLSTIFNANFTSIPEDKITGSLLSATERAANDKFGLVSVIAGFAIQVLSESKIRQAYVAGASNLLQHPEFRDVDKAQRVLNYISGDGELTGLPMPGSDNDVKILIGPENMADELRDSSVVAASFNAGDEMRGLIGVVGPTRMDYPGVAARLSYIAERLSYAMRFSGPRNIDEHRSKGDESNGQEKEQ